MPPDMTGHYHIEDMTFVVGRERRTAITQDELSLRWVLAVFRIISAPVLGRRPHPGDAGGEDAGAGGGQLLGGDCVPGQPQPEGRHRAHDGRLRADTATAGGFGRSAATSAATSAAARSRCWPSATVRSAHTPPPPPPEPRLNCLKFQVSLGLAAVQPRWRTINQVIPCNQTHHSWGSPDLPLHMPDPSQTVGDGPRRWSYHPPPPGAPLLPDSIAHPLTLRPAPVAALLCRWLRQPAAALRLGIL